MTDTSPRLTRRATTRLALGVMLAIAAIAGCGAPNDSGGDDAKGDLQVGTLFPTSGTVAAAGTDMLRGWRLWWKINGDTVAGRKIVAKQEDTAGDPTVTLTKARKLVQQDQSKLLVGPLLANEAYALAGYLEQNKTLVGLNPVGSSDDLSQRKRVANYVKAGGWVSSAPMHPAGDWAADKGWKRVITLCSDYAFGYENCGGFTNTFTDRGGKVVKQLYAPLGTSDYSSYLSQIDPDKVDGVFVQSVGADSPNFIKGWSDLGLKGKVPLIANETTFEQSTLRNIKNADPVGLESFAHFAEGRQSPATEKFVQEFKKEYGTLHSYYACATYTAGQWLTTALKQLKGDTSDQQKFLSTLNGTKLDDSCFGPLSLDRYGGPVGNVYLRKVVRNEQGELVNQVERTYRDVSQFWKYNPEQFLAQPVYSRKYQGVDWPSQ
jgi:branched-chain amino acid transport system substrate-binding protein